MEKVQPQSGTLPRHEWPSITIHKTIISIEEPPPPASSIKKLKTSQHSGETRGHPLANLL